MSIATIEGFSVAGGFLEAAFRRPREKKIQDPKLADLADMVLEASSVAELDELIEIAVVDDRIFEISTKAPEPVPKGFLGRLIKLLDAWEVDRAWQHVIGQDGVKRCAKSIKDLRRHLRTVKVVGDAFAATNIEAQSKEKGTDQISNLQAVFYDPSLPAPFRDALGCTLRLTVAFFVIARAQERGMRMDPWMSRGIVDAFTSLGDLGNRLMGDRLASEPAKALLDALTNASDDSAEFTRMVARWSESASQDRPYFPLGDAHAR